MTDCSFPRTHPASGRDSFSKARRASLAFILSVAVIAAGGCSLPGIRRTVSVPTLLAPQAEAVGTAQLLAEINRFAAVRSIRGKVDVQFLDTSFAKCGVAEKYRTADGDIIVQRPGQVYVSIKAPFVGTKIAEMTSDGARFRVAVLQGEERYKRFVQGTNSAVYKQLQTEANLADDDCGDKKKRNQERTVSALSGLRPQHFTDALLVRPVGAGASGDAAGDLGLMAGMTYARSEFFIEEPDDRTGSKRGARVVRPYYLLDELAAREGNESRLARRFWFDRSEKSVRLARVQTYDDAGALVTDVLYRDPQPVGETNAVRLPARIELTRPQDRYAIRITYQTPAAVVLDNNYEADIFALQNQWQLPEVDLDKE